MKVYIITAQVYDYEGNEDFDVFVAAKQTMQEAEQFVSDKTKELKFQAETNEKIENKLHLWMKGPGRNARDGIDREVSKIEKELGVNRSSWNWQIIGYKLSIEEVDM